ncbi:Smr/MutS family protein [Candidatus Nomurabacteria bacterium]|uniref:Smr/MutS family protein n=1 Tax=Candidatus Dojkabacteria bacterium TaxID=2099670 RepID=A0A955I0J6_9BACT|nr:Smr/MutS family protein [Candidatus Dojkabacteria bacterium]MCB9790067.1 Smr/MutS family protein [Candidatus Nomurabacteria bacterium]
MKKVKKTTNKKNYTLDELKVMFDEFKAEVELDYHSYGILTPEAVRHIYHEFIKECQTNSKKRLLIITGRGAVVRPTIQKVLRSDKRIERYNIAGTFNGKSGAFEVILI